MSGRDDESCDIMRHHATSCDRERKRVGSGWHKMSFDRKRCGRETRWRERKRRTDRSRKQKRKTGRSRKRKGFPLHPPSCVSSEGGGGLSEGDSPLRLAFRAREGVGVGWKDIGPSVSRFEPGRGWWWVARRSLAIRASKGDAGVSKDTKAPFVSLETPGRGMGLVEGDIPLHLMYRVTEGDGGLGRG